HRPETPRSLRRGRSLPISEFPLTHARPMRSEAQRDQDRHRHRHREKRLSRPPPARGPHARPEQPCVRDHRHWLPRRRDGTTEARGGGKVGGEGEISRRLSSRRVGVGHD
ncbi:unnamed protein product, partial [Ectocarpus sp. 12 AP-2014]